MNTIDANLIECPAPKLSALIRMALEDVRRIDADPRYAYDPREYHGAADPALPAGPENPCTVCLAGAVLASRTGTEPHDTLDEDVPGWMMALEKVRAGNLQGALEWMSDDHPDPDERVVVARIEERAAALGHQLGVQGEVEKQWDFHQNRPVFEARMALYAQGLEGLDL